MRRGVWEAREEVDVVELRNRELDLSLLLTRWRDTATKRDWKMGSLGDIVMRFLGGFHAGVAKS